MSIFSQFQPHFLKAGESTSGPFRQMFNYRRIWKKAILLVSLVTLLPLVIITAVDYNFTEKSIESENNLRTLRNGSNTRRTISYFLQEHRSALTFISGDNSPEQLKDTAHLQGILANLQESFAGFVDLGVINQEGKQINYVGPYGLEGKDYGNQEWFREMERQNFAISDVFLGYRNVPHFVVETKHNLANGSFLVLRSDIEIAHLQELLHGLELSGRADAFLINRQGIIQTPTLYHGEVFSKLPYAVPPFSERTEIREEKNKHGEKVIFCSAYIPESPFILIIVKDRNELMKPWRDTRLALIGFLVGSVTVIVLVIFGFATYMVNSMYLLDQRRLATLHQMEYSNKLASIGRLAAGVAHEVNNPLAIINEKAGLIKDLLVYANPWKGNEEGEQFGTKLSTLLDAILSSVARCGKITKRLLNFARHMDSTIETIDLTNIISEVLSFLHKEAEYRNITVNVDIAPDIPHFPSDRGKLQQIFLNIINNAFAAMNKGGRLEIAVSNLGEAGVRAIVTDNGCGIAEEDIGKIFEPFFSTKTKQGGTGLGLSITYGLLLELGGKVEVSSKLGEGTSFTVTLPLTPPATTTEK
jgi:two-component system, NtrC family, sensor kinase